MNSPIRSILAPSLFLAITAICTSAAAQTEAPTSPLPSPTEPVRVLVETDPATFALSGYSAHVRVPLGHSGLTLGAGLYGLNLPDFVADLHPHNEGRDFHLAIRSAYSLFADYHFSGQPEGVFVGVQAALQRHEVREGERPEMTEVGTVLLMPRLGYLWTPSKDLGLYLMPWVGAGPSIEVYRTNDDNDDYSSLPVLAFGTLHVGWKFH